MRKRAATRTASRSSSRCRCPPPGAVNAQARAESRRPGAPPPRTALLPSTTRATPCTSRSAPPFRPLRSRHVFPTLRIALARANRRAPKRFRIVHFSVQHDHLHLIVEASNQRASVRRHPKPRHPHRPLRERAPRPKRPLLGGPLPRSPAHLAASGAKRARLRARELQKTFTSRATARHRSVFIGRIVRRFPRVAPDTARRRVECRFGAELEAVQRRSARLVGATLGRTRTATLSAHSRNRGRLRLGRASGKRVAHARWLATPRPHRAVRGAVGLESSTRCAVLALGGRADGRRRSRCGRRVLRAPAGRASARRRRRESRA